MCNKWALHQIKINNKNDIQRLLLSLLLLILLSGDICVNQELIINAMVVRKSLLKEYKIQCRECNKLFHPICGSIITNKFIVNNNYQLFICQRCQLKANSEIEMRDKNLMSTDLYFQYKKSKGLKILHFNSRSIINKVDHFRLITSLLSPHILCVSESWRTNWWRSYCLLTK